MPEMNVPFDFTNEESIEEALAILESTDAPKGAKAPKVAKPKIIDVTFTADRDILEGEVVTFKFEVPKSTRSRGMVAGIALTDMTVDELKIEYRNANSVAYKTKKAGRDASKAEARLEAVKAELANRGIQPGARTSSAKTIDANQIAALIASGAISLEALQAALDAQAKTEAE